MKYKAKYYDAEDSLGYPVILKLETDYVSIINDAKNTEFRWTYNDISLSGEPRPANHCKVKVNTSLHSWIGVEDRALWIKLKNKVERTKARKAPLLFKIIAFILIISLIVSMLILFLLVYKPDLLEPFFQQIHKYEFYKLFAAIAE
jgi:hypothetical protein